jgi:hypothetical protein
LIGLTTVVVRRIPYSIRATATAVAVRIVFSMSRAVSPSTAAPRVRRLTSSISTRIEAKPSTPASFDVASLRSKMRLTISIALQLACFAE